MKNKITVVIITLLIIAGLAVVVSKNSKNTTNISNAKNVTTADATVTKASNEVTKASKEAVKVKLAVNKNSPAAIVNGKEIKKDKIIAAINKLSLNDKGKKKAFNVIVNQAISEKLLEKEIIDSKIEDEDSFKKRLKAAEIQLSKTIFLERYLKSQVTEKAVNNEYKKIKKENAGKKEAHARHILLKTKAEAEQVIKDLNNGADFKELAKKRSSDPNSKNGGDIGYFAKGEIIPAFSDAAFKLKPHTYTKKPVKSPFGWHVIYLEAKRDRTVPKLKDVENNIRAKLGQAAIEKLIVTLRAKADIKQFDINGEPLKETKKN